MTVTVLVWPRWQQFLWYGCCHQRRVLALVRLRRLLLLIDAEEGAAPAAGYCGLQDARGVRAAAASAAGSREEARPCGVAPARGAPKRWRPDGWCSTTVPPLPAAAAAPGEDDRSARPLRIMPPMLLMVCFSAPRTPPPPPPLGLTVEAAALTPDPVGLVGSDSRARSVSRPRALSSAPSGTGDMGGDSDSESAVLADWRRPAASTSLALLAG